MSVCFEWTRSWLNFASFIVALCSYFSPWNDTSPLAVAASHPVGMRPANYAYSIYGVIYLALSVFTIWQLVPSNHKQYIVKDIGYWFIFTCIFQAIWVPLFNYGYFHWAGLVNVLVFLCLARVNAGLHRASNWARFPFTLWFGWNTVAVFVSLSTFLVYTTNAKVFLNPFWVVTLILVSGTLAAFWLRFTGEYGFPLAITWAAFGILAADYSNTINICALSTGVFLATLMPITAFFQCLNKRRNPTKRMCKDEEDHVQVTMEVQPPTMEPPPYLSYPMYQTPGPVYTCYWPSPREPFVPVEPPKQ